MADYVKVFIRLILIVPLLLQPSVASEEPDVTCGFPGAPAYGNVKPGLDAYDDGDVVTYSCRVGYILLGAPISRCTEDGSWSEDVPICDDSMTTLGIASSTPTVPGHAADMAIDRDRDTCTYLKPKKTRWWRIDLGEVHKILSVAVTMSSTDYMKFTIYIVEIQGQIASYKRCVSFSGRFGSQTLLFACAEGKGLEGQTIHIEDHLQHDYFEICEVEVQVEKDTDYDCGRPDRRPFSMTYEPEGDKVEYACDTGYALIGESERECLPSGQWSGEAPVCKPIVCEPLSAPENGELTYSVLNGDTPLEGSTAIYKCNYGYELSGDITRLCLKDGSWSGKDPVCKVIRCPLPEGKHDGETYRILNKTNRVGSIAKLRCRKGVAVGDDPYITCTIEGEWTEPKAQCIQQGGSTMSKEEQPIIVNRGGIIFGMAVAAIMMVIILASFYVVKRRRDANKPQLPSRQQEPPVPPPRPPPRAKGLKSALMDLVSRDSSAYKYESLNLENGEGGGGAAWKTRSLPLETGNNEGMTEEQGAPRRTLSYDDPEKLASRGTDAQFMQEKRQEDAGRSAPDEKQEDTSEKGSPVTTPVKSSGEYAAVDYDKKRQSRLLKEQDSEDKSQGPSPSGNGEQLRELPPIPKEEEEEETRAQSAEVAPSPSTDKEKDQEVVSVESEDVSLPIAPSESQTSEAPTPSPDVVIENQVEGPSASPSTPPSETTPGRRRQRGARDQPSTEQVPDARRTRRRAEPEEPESPSPAPAEEERPSRRAPGGRADEPESPPAAPVEEERPSRRARAGRTDEPESPPAAPAEEERPSRRARAGRADEPESPPAAPAEEERPSRRARAGRADEPESPPAAPAEEERPTRRTRPWAASRFDTPSTASQPSYRKRY